MSSSHAVRLRCLSAVLPAALAAGACLGGRTVPPPDAWSAAPPLGHARTAHAVVATQEAVWALGGTGADGPVLEVEAFDGRRWRDVARLPGEGLNAPAAAVIGDRIYLIGGFGTTTNVPTDRVRVYDTRGGTWSEAAPLPAPRGGHAAVVLDGRIHVFGGGNSQSTLADHSVYDPAADRWEARAPLPRAKGSPAAVVVDGRIWSIGGRSGYSDFGEVDVYDAAADRWRPGPPIPPRGTHGAVVYRGAVHVVGGESEAERAALASMLVLRDGEWRAAPPLPTPRMYARAVVFRGAIWVIGGDPRAGNSHAGAGATTVERFGPAPDAETAAGASPAAASVLAADPG